jgi:hypothetical protein
MKIREGKMKIYVASSWRNAMQPEVVGFLRGLGHDVYDFRHPEPGNDGFAWEEISPNWRVWTEKEFEEALHHPAAVAGFQLDRNALLDSDMVLLVLPSGRSAHIEAGAAIGQSLATGKPQYTAVLLDEAFEPELMYKFFNYIFVDFQDMKEWFERQKSTATA